MITNELIETLIQERRRDAARLQREQDALAMRRASAAGGRPPRRRISRLPVVKLLARVFTLAQA